MLQRVESIFKRLRRDQKMVPAPVPSESVPPSLPQIVEPSHVLLPSVDWAPVIWGYATGLAKNGDRIERMSKECNDRGLAYGMMQILHSSESRIRVRVMADSKLFPTDLIIAALEEAITALKLSDDVFVRCGRDGIEVITKEESALPVCNTPSFNRGSYRTFASGCNGEFDVYSVEALHMVLHAFASLGYFAGPKHYSHESPVKIEDIVLYAQRWEDAQMHCRYLDVLFRPELVKHKVCYGSHRSHERAEGSVSGEVLVTRSWNSVAVDWPKMFLNNYPVYSIVVADPTEAMLKARDWFSKKTLEYCRFCKENLATQEFHCTHVSFGDGGSIGFTIYSCDNVGCIEQANTFPCLSRSQNPYQQEVWI